MTDELADHYPTAVELGKKEKKSKQEDKLIPLQNEKALADLKSSLSKIDWTPVLSDNTIQAFSTFQKMFTECHTKACPLIKPNKRSIRQQPYMTKGLLKSRRVKMRLYKKAVSKNNTDAWDIYKKYLHKYKKLIQKAKILHYRKEFEKAGKDSRKIWQVADEICGRKLGKSSEIGNIEGCSNDQEKSDKFSEYYYQIPYSLANDLPATTHSYKDFLPKIDIKKPFRFQKVTEQSVLKTIKGLKPKTSWSFDNVSNKQLKFIAEEISKPMAHLINTSFEHSYTPPEWKCSRIIPIFKSGNRELVNNYRPIALLSTFSKILEKQMSYQVWRHLNSNKILSDQQYGFKHGCSTEHLLIDLMDKLFKNKNAKKYTLAIFVDCRKAFDVVDHDILKAKIAHYGLPVDWFADYLTDGEQMIFVGNKKSKKMKINIGVRQGSILGPLLFLLMIEDLIRASKLYTLLFADDCTLTNENSSIDELFAETNNELKKVEAWYNANRLSLHPDKCRYILFSETPPPDKLHIGGKEIMQVSDNSAEKSFKIVGLHLDQHINFQHHINHLRTKIRSALSMITHSKKYLPRKIKLMLFNALINSHFQYAIIIWGRTTQSILDPLWKLQKQSIRVAMGAKWTAHCDPLFKKANCLKLADLHEAACCKQAYKIMIYEQQRIDPTVWAS